MSSLPGDFSAIEPKLPSSFFRLFGVRHATCIYEELLFLMDSAERSPQIERRPSHIQNGLSDTE